MRATVVIYDCPDAPRVVNIDELGIRATRRAIEGLRREARRDYFQLPPCLDELAAVITSGREAASTGEERTEVELVPDVSDAAFVNQATAARRLGCDARTVRSYLDSGALPSVRPHGGNRKIRRVDLDRFAEQNASR